MSAEIYYLIRHIDGGLIEVSREIWLDQMNYAPFEPVDFEEGECIVYFDAEER